jgi:hypothetical protein
MTKRLDERRFGYLSNKDRMLLRDAARLRGDAFLTVERRLPWNSPAVEELEIRVLTPFRIGICSNRGQPSDDWREMSSHEQDRIYLVLNLPPAIGTKM